MTALDPIDTEHTHRHAHDHPATLTDADWHRSARWVRRLAWIGLLLVAMEGSIGLWQGLVASSIALTGWALGSIPEALAGAMVIWRFTGSRTRSDAAERRAQIGVAASFWLMAPYVAVESARDLLTGSRAETSVIGIAVTAVAAVVMPVLGRAQRRLGNRLSSAATVGEGVQNYLCAIQATAVLVGLLVCSLPGGRWVDPVIGLAVAAVAVWQGFRSWRGEGCGC